MQKEDWETLQERVQKRETKENTLQNAKLVLTRYPANAGHPGYPPPSLCGTPGWMWMEKRITRWMHYIDTELPLAFLWRSDKLCALQNLCRLLKVKPQPTPQFPEPSPTPAFLCVTQARYLVKSEKPVLQCWALNGKLLCQRQKFFCKWTAATTATITTKLSHKTGTVDRGIA